MSAPSIPRPRRRTPTTADRRAPSLDARAGWVTTGRHTSPLPTVDTVKRDLVDDRGDRDLRAPVLTAAGFCGSCDGPIDSATASCRCSR